MKENGKPSLIEALGSATREDLIDLDKAIADKSGEIDALSKERDVLVRLRGYTAKILGIEPTRKGSNGAHGDGSLGAKIENLIREKGALTTAEIAATLGRKEGGVKLAIRKQHYRFTVVDENKIGLVGSGVAAKA